MNSYMVSRTVINESENKLLERGLPNTNSFASHLIPDIGILNQKNKYIDLNVVKRHLLNSGYLSIKQALKILHDSSIIISKEPNLLELNRKVYVIGDIHGQFYDLISLLSKFDLKKDTLLFLGDYVDRGLFSTEVYLYLMLLKSYYPDNIFLLRGNHESEKMTSYFTFHNECLVKYNEKVYNSFLASFMNLPLAAVIQNKAYCCHGGISPDLFKLKDINNIDRYREVEYQGLMCDILWSDPDEDFNSDSSIWKLNKQRNCSYFYNANNVSKFLNSNNLEIILRGHEVQENGYKILTDNNGKPLVVTIFSAPNYCDIYQNNGCIVEFDQKILNFIEFSAVDHPYVLKEYIDGINWSFPFVLEKGLELSNDIINFLSKYDNNYSSSSTEQSSETNNNEIIKQLEKRIQKIKIPINIMRQERENIDELVLDEESSLDNCALQSTDSDVNNFEDAVKKDSINEIKKEETESISQTIDLSPSINKSIKDKEIIDHSKRKSKGFFSFFK